MSASMTTSQLFSPGSSLRGLKLGLQSLELNRVDGCSHFTRATYSHRSTQRQDYWLHMLTTTLEDVIAGMSHVLLVIRSIATQQTRRSSTVGGGTEYPRHHNYLQSFTRLIRILSLVAILVQSLAPDRGMHFGPAYHGLAISLISSYCLWLS